MAKQGKCIFCKVRYVWNIEVPLKQARCPRCKQRLQSTTHLQQWPIVRLTAVRMKRGGK